MYRLDHSVNANCRGQGTTEYPTALTNFDDSKNLILKPTNKVLKWLIRLKRMASGANDKEDSFLMKIIKVFNFLFFNKNF